MYTEEKRAELLNVYEKKLFEKEFDFLAEEKYSDSWYKKKKEYENFQIGVEGLRKKIENKYYIEGDDIVTIYSNDLQELENYIEKNPKLQIRMSHYYQ